MRRKKEEKDKQRTREKRKSTNEEIDSLKKKRKVMCDAIGCLKKESSGLFDKAEDTGQFKFFLAANALRKNVVEKESIVEELDIDIKSKEDLLKNMI